MNFFSAFVFLQTQVTLVFVFCSFAQAQSVHGVFRVVKGDIRILQSTQKKEVPAKIGQKVFPKDVIIAGADSRAKVVMLDNNEINISPDSKVEIQNYEFKPKEDKKNVILNVLYGKVRAKVEQKYENDNKFQVKTPTAVAGVRGTDFFTSYSSSTKETKVITFSGRVEFGQPGSGGKIENPVQVGPGQTTSAVGSAPPSPPVEVPKAELAQMETQTDASKATANGSDAGQESREPANQESNKKEESQKDEPQNEGTSDNSNASKEEGTNASTEDNSKSSSQSAASGDSRMPSSEAGSSAPAPAPAGGGMLLDSDLPSSANATVPTVPPTTAGGLPLGPVPLPPVNLPPPTNDFVNDIISTGKRRVTVKICASNC